MATKLLLPYSCKRIGWFILIPVTLVGIWLTFSEYEVSWLEWKIFALYNSAPLGPATWFNWTDINVSNTLLGVLFIISAIMVGFSKEKYEDEFIRELRLSSLLWAVWIHYALLLLAFLFVYGVGFLTVMVYNMFTILLLFIIRFNYLLYKQSKNLPSEEQYQGSKSHS